MGIFPSKKALKHAKSLMQINPMNHVCWKPPSSYDVKSPYQDQGNSWPSCSTRTTSHCDWTSEPIFVYIRSRLACRETRTVHLPELHATSPSPSEYSISIIHLQGRKPTEEVQKKSLHAFSLSW